MKKYIAIIIAVLAFVSCNEWLDGTENNTYLTDELVWKDEASAQLYVNGFYTYLSTLHYVMEACAEADVSLLVLDRPNPNGHYVDGPVLDTARLRSFVGMHPVPVVYGMTIGEYARMINGEGWLEGGRRCRLGVVPMQYDGFGKDALGVADTRGTR